MRKLPGAVLGLLLLPAVLAAQKTPSVKNAPPAPVSGVVTLQQATNAALARVKSDLSTGKLGAWGEGDTGRGISPGSVSVKGGQVATWDDFFVVAVTSPNARGHVRVVVNRRTGAVVSARAGSWDWGNAPDWWLRGYDNPVFNKPKQQSSAH